MKKISIFYATEFKHNIYSLFFSLLVLGISLGILIYFTLFFFNPLIFWIPILGILFGTFKSSRQFILIYKLQKLVKKIEIERINTYIYMNWFEKKTATPWVGGFYLILLTILGTIFTIIYSINIMPIISNQIMIISIIIIWLAVFLTLITTIINFQYLNNIIIKHQNYIKFDDLSTEIQAQVKKTKLNYKKIIIYTFFLILFIPLFLLLFPNIKKWIEEEIKK